MRISPTTWACTVDLRCAVLGWASEPVPGDLDMATVHLAAIDESERIVGVVSYLPHPCPDRVGAPAVYFWAMTVACGFQRAGIGRALLTQVVSGARDMRARILWADARVTAVPFYRRCGGAVVGELYEDEVTGLQDQRVIFDIGST